MRRLKSLSWMFSSRDRDPSYKQNLTGRKDKHSLETEVSAKFASPEDTVLAKQEWYRMGGEVS